MKTRVNIVFVFVRIKRYLITKKQDVFLSQLKRKKNYVQKITKVIYIFETIVFNIWIYCKTIHKNNNRKKNINFILQYVIKKCLTFQF